MANASTYGNESYDNRSKRRHGLGWVPWVALALLVVLLVGSYLLAMNATDNGDRAGLDASNDPTGQATGVTPQGREGVFAADGTDVLVVGSQALSLVGQDVTANNVVVRSVVADEGFWVSAAGSQQLFVHLSEAARPSGGESAVQVRAGQRVDVSGTLADVPSDVSALGVNASEGASQLRNTGVYLDATSLTVR